MADYALGVTITAQATVNVGASPRDVLEFVLDLDQYRRVDPKIQRVRSVEGPDDEGRGSARIWGKVKGLPPAPDRQDFVLEPWIKLTFTGAPRQPARLIFDFTGTIACHERQDGTTDVTHSYEFNFKGPFSLVERFLGNWLQCQIEDELQTIASQF